MPDSPAPRYGIAEWYGKPFLSLSDTERVAFSRVSLSESQALACPFRSDGGSCNKQGGVCSIRRLGQERGNVAYADTDASAIAIACPNRFKQDDSIYAWIGETLLGEPNVVNLGEIGFLERVNPDGSIGSGREVGRIDNILVVPNSNPLHWCAVETQAVYFSGNEMEVEFRALQAARGRPVFPVGKRRPDFRSSGPKRLMPQLQTKVPTLRRWGKKTAVVVDVAFFESLAPMTRVADLSSADIAWFIVAASDGDTGAALRHIEVRFSTLEDAVAGLTAGRPVAQPVFEDRIRERLSELERDQAN
ncbi:MAG: hypothetical protein K2Y21_10940 [Phycisphaerales bacterium]|nr:hypothetical protein [Phycisphaerales bacterium]